ncbi:hypothetical protein BDB00DRAFT_173543 [Zychaea mexicana]|uniref:uncharacterized protein n=1 Tax=Zychaea mexicana TaxID=64656 RepID=UPI0022FE38F1|nr:uncharacterized protein BDB00DRAFT_173543 [Zychaea mexicana]KAI9479612.1 hypothetical protein BDB00DRAFT_173543 [Zychaea mexicana]
MVDYVCGASMWYFDNRWNCQPIESIVYSRGVGVPNSKNKCQGSSYHMRLILIRHSLQHKVQGWRSHLFLFFETKWLKEFSLSQEL